MKASLNVFSILAATAMAFGMASNAFADCSQINDPQWNDLSVQMATAYDKGNYEEALKIGKQLTVICNRSPIVNFTMSEIYRKSGNEQESDKFAERATEYILDYPVPQALNERIWLRAAENKLPYKKQLSDLQGRMTKMAGDLRTCNEEKEQLAGSDAALKENAIRSEYLLQQSKSSWGAALWSGVGIMTAGVGMTIAGAVLVKKADKIEKSGETTTEKSGFSVTKPYVAGWALLGAGIVATVGGTVLTGIAGYHYTHIDVDLDSDGNKDESLSFNLSPMGASFGMTF